MNRIHYFLPGVLLVVVSACVTTGVKPTAPPQQGIYLDHLNSQARGSADWFGDLDRERTKLKKTYKGTVAPELATYLEKDVYLVESDGIEAYHRKILDRLLTGWEGPRPEVSFIFESDENMNAYVDVYNQIHVSTGLLRSVENEDQLASVLAHEISHVLLKHNQQKSASKVIPWSIEMAGTLSVAAAGIAYNKDKKQKYADYAEKAVIGSQSLGMAWSDMLAPSWSRNYEREADRLGLDLLIRADYNYEQFYATIEKLHDASLRRSARQEYFMGMTVAALKGSKSKFYKGDPNDKKDKMLGDLKYLAASSFAALTFNKIAQANVEHDTREQRIDAIKTYLGEAYDGGDLPPEADVTSYKKVLRQGSASRILDADLAAIKTIKALNEKDVSTAKRQTKSLGWGFNGAVNSVGIAQSSYKTAVQRQPDSAIKTLRRLTQSEFAPAEAYVKLSDLYLQKRDPESAKQVLHQGINRIGRKYRFLPNLVSAHKMAGETKQAEDYVIECQEHNPERNMNLAQRALAGTKKSKGGYYSYCTKKLGYDVLARREQEARRQAQQRKANTPESVKKASEKLDKMLKGLFN